MRRLSRIALAFVATLVAGAGLVAAIYWEPDRPVAALVARWAPPPSQFVELDGMSVHLRDEGDREDPCPILLLHGTSASLHTWEGWTRRLLPRRVIRLDLPGFALTGPRPDGDYSFPAYLAFLRTLNRPARRRALRGHSAANANTAFREQGSKARSGSWYPLAKPASPFVDRERAMICQALRRYPLAILASLLFAGAAAGQDPAVVNASSTRLTLENDRVRVYETTLAPGEKENPHSHAAAVIYVIAGGKLRLHNPDGTTSEATLETGTTFFREPITHWTENIGDTTFKVMLVEVKTPAKEAKPAN